MAGRRVYGGTNMAVILQNEGVPPETIEALLACGSSSDYHGSSSVVNFENVCGSAPERVFYRLGEQEVTGDEDLDECSNQPEKKRRLTADQVQFLERSFELENKLEPQRKIKLARDLGLQPRQVAIWFQNRRARWKTKQLEKDYEALKANYNSLMADYENLSKEKKKLKAEVLNLSDKLLQREKQRSNSETSQLNNRAPPQQLPKPDRDSVSEAKNKRDVPILVACKQEDVDISSGNSIVFDSDSPHFAEGAHSSQLEPANSSNANGVERSDGSHTEEEEEEKAQIFPKVEDSSCSYGFPVEEQAFWFWPY